MNISQLLKQEIKYMIIISLITYACLGNFVTGSDISSVNDVSGGLEGSVSNVVPAITNFDMLDSNYNSILDSQVDVNTLITVNVTIEDTNGWDDIDTVEVMLWYDGGSEGYFSGQASGHNYRLLLYYDNTASGGNGQSAPTTTYMDAKYSTSSDHFTVTDGTHAVSEVTANQKYKMTWKFTMGYQVKQANLPSASDGTSYANANSWNAMINVTDAAATTSQNNNGTDAYEFGVYKYSYLSVGSYTWNFGSVSPGSNADASIGFINTACNDDFDLTVWVNGDLTCSDPSDTISTSGGYIKILGNADGNDDLYGDETFTQNLEAGEKTILESSGGHGDHSAYRSSSGAQWVAVNFNVAVPFGSLPGTYSAGLTFQITHA